MRFGLQKLQRKSSAIKWLVLAALAWSQLAFAEHQFEHHSFESSESCNVCVQFDRDDQVSCDSQLTVQQAANIAPPLTSTTQIPAVVVATYNARASP